MGRAERHAGDGRHTRAEAGFSCGFQESDGEGGSLAWSCEVRVSDSQLGMTYALLPSANSQSQAGSEASIGRRAAPYMPASLPRTAQVTIVFRPEPAE